MPLLYLSPSTQEWNSYVTGSGSEEYQMNLLADALEPYLRANGIQFRRNRPEMTAASSIREANSSYYDFYLALHSNAAPEGQYGKERGTEIFSSFVSDVDYLADGHYLINFGGMYKLEDGSSYDHVLTSGDLKKTASRQGVVIEIVDDEVVFEARFHGNANSNIYKAERKDIYHGAVELTL